MSICVCEGKCASEPSFFNEMQSFLAENVDFSRRFNCIYE